MDNPTTSSRSPAPISASAFSFHVTPARAPARQLRPLSTPTAFASPSSKALETNTPMAPPSQRKVKVEVSDYTTSLHTLDSLPSPLFFRPRTPPGLSKPTKRLHELVDNSSPFPLRGRADCGKPTTDGKRLGAIPAWEDVAGQPIGRKKDIQLVEEGVGVSPRRHKGLKYTGKG
jgi:hypothetical protein